MEFQDQQTTFDKQQLINLVHAAQNGDRRAFDQLFERYRGAVYGTAYRRIRNDAEAQELCQEVFIQALRKLHQLQNPLCVGGWLRSIANRMAINRAVRTRAVCPLESDWLEDDCREDETPLGRILARERQDQVHLGLDRLPELDRDTLLAFYFRGQSLVEMSDEFESPVGTIKRRLHVARKRLAKELAVMAPA